MHFSATSHGKGACDGVGGTVKRLASRASLQRPYDQQIMTPHQMFEWASNNIQGIVFQYCSCVEYERSIGSPLSDIPYYNRNTQIPLFYSCITREYASTIIFNVNDLQNGKGDKARK